MRSEALFGLAEFAFLVRGGRGGRFLAIGDIIARNLEKKGAEKKRQKWDSRRADGQAEDRRDPTLRAISVDSWAAELLVLLRLVPFQDSSLDLGGGGKKSLSCKCTDVAKDKTIKTEGKRDLRLEKWRTMSFLPLFLSAPLAAWDWQDDSPGNSSIYKPTVWYCLFHPNLPLILRVEQIQI